MDRRIKFRHLEAFSAIARERSLKRAAEELNLTQPAISKTLKELEQIVGVVLVERSRSGVWLTDQGEVFLQFAEQSISALRHGLRSVSGQGKAAGQLRIGALPTVAGYLLPAAVEAFAAQAPGISVEIQEGPHTDLTGRLRAGGLDLVIGRLGRPETMDGLGFLQLYAEEVIIVTHPQSPAAKVRNLEELNQFRVLYPPAESAIRPLVARFLIGHGIPLFDNRIESASSAFGRAATLADDQTVWFISRGVVADELAEGRLVALNISMSATAGPVGIMSRAEEVPSIAQRTFTRVLVRTAEKLQSGI